MRSYLANTSWSMPQGETPFESGAKWGQAISQVGGAIKSMADVDKAAEAKTKIDTLIQQFNSGTGVFAGIEPASLRTEKLARLLIPLDEKLAARYAQRATEEKAQETRAGQAKSVAEAYRRAPTEVPMEGLDAVDSEIKAIEAELLNRKKQADSQYSPVTMPEAPAASGPGYALPYYLQGAV